MGRFKRKVRSLGQSVVETLRAELDSLFDDFSVTGKRLVVILALLTAALILTFWAAGVGTAFLIALLATRLAVWQAAGLVFLLFLLASAGLVFWAWRRLREVETPAQTVRRHLDDHFEWWERHLERDAPRFAGTPRGVPRVGAAEAPDSTPYDPREPS